MSSKIESITATVPVTGQSYTDLRPTISADSIEEYRAQLAEVGRLAGNEQFVQRMEQNRKGKTKIITPDGNLYFDPVLHTYEDDAGQIFRTGSTWAKRFEEPFNPELIAPKVAEKKLTTVDKVIEGWEMKGEVSLMYGSTVHKALECAIKYNEVPNNPYLATLVQDYLDMTHDEEQTSELFVANFRDRMCGTIDVLVNKGPKPECKTGKCKIGRVIIRDFKTGDIYKKTKLTAEAKEYWPDLDNKTISLYQIQLSFYAHIMKSKGYAVEGLEIYAENDGAWQVVKLPVLDVERALQAI